MKTSESIAKLAAALAKAQAQVEGATKDSKNPHFGSQYADLASVRDASLPHLNKFGLSVVQLPFTDGAVVRLETVLLHESGEWLSGEPLGAQGKDAGPQTVGSCITYLRRQSLAALAGVAPVDDDAEAAQERGNGQQTGKLQTVAAPPKGYIDWLTDMEAVVNEGTDRLAAAWKNSKAEYRSYLTTTAPKKWDAMKAAAATVRESVAS